MKKDKKSKQKEKNKGAICQLIIFALTFKSKMLFKSQKSDLLLCSLCERESEIKRGKDFFPHTMMKTDAVSCRVYITWLQSERGVDLVRYCQYSSCSNGRGRLMYTWGNQSVDA